jgi:hypothetical protein
MSLGIMLIRVIVLGLEKELFGWEMIGKKHN